MQKVEGLPLAIRQSGIEFRVIGRPDPIADVQVLVQQLHSGKLSSARLFPNTAVMEALDHKWSRADEGSYLGIIEFFTETEFKNLIFAVSEIATLKSIRDRPPNPVAEIR